MPSSPLALQSDWNGGTVEEWNYGMMWNRRGKESSLDCFLLTQYSSIPIFHHSIVPIVTGERTD
jgi:hypothetical protein